MRQLFTKLILTAAVLLALGVWFLARSPYNALRVAGVAATSPFVKVWRSLELRAGELLPRRRRDARQTRHLLERIQALELETARLREQLRACAELEALSALPPNPGWQRVLAPVIARDPMSYQRRFRIGKGMAHGIAAGNVVLAGANVIGRVTDCTRTTAVVTTVADPSCRLSVLVGSAENAGVLTGAAPRNIGLGRYCQVRFLPPNTSCAADAPVTTSGLAVTTPRGLPVARVVALPGRPVVTLTDAVEASVLVEPLADLGALSYVAVCVRPEPDRPLRRPR